MASTAASSPSNDALLQYFALCQYPSIHPPTNASTPTPQPDIVAATLALNPAAAALADPATLARLFTYRVPNLSPDGTCSLPDDLSATPFNIAQQLYSLPLDSTLLPTHAATLRQYRLQHVVKELQARTQCEWVGVYERVAAYSAERLYGHSTSDPAIHTQAAAILTGASSGSPTNASDITSSPSAFSTPTQPDAYPALVKLAYVGEASRAVFPLTEAFAALSGNSHTAMQARVHVIGDTRKREAGSVYYECSGRVRSECCVPILDKRGECVGIVDVESWTAGVADSDAVVWEVGKVCQQLGETGLIGGQL